MRVSLYADCDAYGGVLTYTMGLSAALREAGAKVVIVTHEPYSPISDSLLTDFRQCADQVLTLPAESDTGRDAKILATALVEAGTDIFLPNYRMMPHAAAALCSRRTSIRSVGVCHNDHSSSYGLLQYYESCLSRMVCASTITSAQLKASLPWRDDEIVTIPHGVSIPGNRCSPFQGGELKLIYHGRLVEEQKRISLLLEVGRRLSRAAIPFHLTLVGDGSEAQECRRAAEEEVLRHRISIHGSQGWASLGPRLAASHVAVLTSDYEGFCLSLAEAMGSGLPAVAFQCGGVIEQFLVHESTGLLVESDDIDAFVAAIARLQSDATLWSHLSVNAYDRIRNNYSWSIAVTEYVKLFEEAMRDPVRRQWPLVRPTWIGAGGRSVRSIVERVGKEVRLWR